MAVLLIVAIAAGVLVYEKVFRKPETDPSQKTITVEIVFAEDNKKTVEIQTKAEFLRGALDEKGLIEGTESAYGFYVTKVDGVEADAAQNQWWCFSKSGEMLLTGVDDTPIQNGDHFEITLSVFE